jgi:hypothetical protein
MKIGLDFGGVMDHDETGWIESIKNALSNGHEIYIVSHAHPGKDHQRRIDLANKSGAIDYTFSDTMDENVIVRRKFDIVKRLGIELFVDDSPNRAIEIRKHNPECGILCFDNLKQGVTKLIFDKITNG